MIMSIHIYEFQNSKNDDPFGMIVVDALRRAFKYSGQVSAKEVLFCL
jgi:hypothetical protein